MLHQWQYVRSSLSFNHIPKNLYIVKDTTNYVRKLNYKVLQSQKADTTNFYSEKAHILQTFVVSKSRHLKLLQSKKADTSNFCNEKAHTTNFCSKKAHTIQNFCSLKKRTLQTLDDLLTLTLTLQYKSRFCSLNLTFVVISVNFVVQVRLFQSFVVYH